MNPGQLAALVAAAFFAVAMCAAVYVLAKLGRLVGAATTLVTNYQAGADELLARCPTAACATSQAPRSRPSRIPAGTATWLGLSEYRPRGDEPRPRRAMASASRPGAASAATARPGVSGPSGCGRQGTRQLRLRRRRTRRPRTGQSPAGRPRTGRSPAGYGHDPARILVHGRSGGRHRRLPAGGAGGQDAAAASPAAGADRPPARGTSGKADARGRGRPARDRGARPRRSSSRLWPGGSQPHGSRRNCGVRPRCPDRHGGLHGVPPRHLNRHRGQLGNTLIGQSGHSDRSPA